MSGRFLSSLSGPALFMYPADVRLTAVGATPGRGRGGRLLLRRRTGRAGHAGVLDHGLAIYPVRDRSYLAPLVCPTNGPCQSRSNGCWAIRRTLQAQQVFYMISGQKSAVCHGRCGLGHRECEWCVDSGTAGGAVVEDCAEGQWNGALLCSAGWIVVRENHIDWLIDWSSTILKNWIFKSEFCLWFAVSSVLWWITASYCPCLIWAEIFTPMLSSAVCWHVRNCYRPRIISKNVHSAEFCFVTSFMGGLLCLAGGLIPGGLRKLFLFSFAFFCFESRIFHYIYLFAFFSSFFCSKNGNGGNYPHRDFASLTDESFNRRVVFAGNVSPGDAGRVSWLGVWIVRCDYHDWSCLWFGVQSLGVYLLVGSIPTSIDWSIDWLIDWLVPHWFTCCFYSRAASIIKSHSWCSGFSAYRAPSFPFPSPWMTSWRSHSSSTHRLSPMSVMHAVRPMWIKMRKSSYSNPSLKWHAVHMFSENNLDLISSVFFMFQEFTAAFGVLSF